MTIEPPPRGCDAITFVKIFFKNFFSAIHNGLVVEILSLWCTEDVILSSERLALPTYAEGLADVVIVYNNVLQHVWGIDSNINFKVEDCTMLCPWYVRMEFLMNITKKDQSEPIVLKRRWELGLRGDKICSIFICPPDRKIQGVKSVEVVQNTEPAPIHPVLTLSPPKPVGGYPCYHNSWDSVRIKKGFSILRCRFCLSQWKTKTCDMIKCKNFPNCIDYDCEMLHIHNKKIPRIERETRGAELARAKLEEKHITKMMKNLELFPAGSHPTGIIVQNFVKSFTESMDSGKVRECFEEWLTVDAIWESIPGMMVRIEANCREQCVTSWITVRELFFGGETAGTRSPLQLDLINASIVSDDTARIDFVIMFSLPTGGEPLKIRRRWEITIDRGLVRKVAAKFPPSEEEEPEEPDEKNSDEANQIPPLPPPIAERPCDHNSWDSVRVKKKRILLRCRTCGKQWKVKINAVKRCAKFPSGSCSNQSCSLLHIHPRKQTLDERVAAFKDQPDEPILQYRDMANEELSGEEDIADETLRATLEALDLLSVP